ncbi:unnamed protein product [Moneuplotes crassus]|uniref:C2H2-type domain-containing protein n=1 Tax=Euplotes crassus TaxID=5936 RepID=A0AAD1XYJ7_EUPCR|nr:unnamed protein product [Moneuplotes crassus]
MNIDHYSDNWGSFSSSEWNYDDFDEKIREDYVSGFKEIDQSDYIDKRMKLNRVSNPSLLISRISFSSIIIPTKEQIRTKKQESLCKLCFKIPKDYALQVTHRKKHNGPRPVSRKIPSKWKSKCRTIEKKATKESKVLTDKTCTSPASLIHSSDRKSCYEPVMQKHRSGSNIALIL